MAPELWRKVPTTVWSPHWKRRRITKPCRPLPAALVRMLVVKPCEVLPVYFVLGSGAATATVTAVAAMAQSQPCYAERAPHRG